MAIPATAVWEVRADADNSGLQGGFHNPDRGGTDYTQQASPQLSLTDIATNGTGTGLSSATGGFTSNMLGSGIYLTGGGATAGWYEVVAYTDTNNVTIDRSAGLSKTGVTGRLGGAITISNAASVTGPVAGNSVWILQGTYTLTGSPTFNNGSEALAIQWRGYASVRGDNPTGATRPLLACGSYSVYLGNYNVFRNVRLSGTATTILVMDAFDVVRNVYGENTSGTAGRRPMGHGGDGTSIFSCELTSTAGYGVYVNNTGFQMTGCYVHDCGESGARLSTSATRGTYDSNIFDTVVVGIQGTSSGNQWIKGNIFYGNTTGGIQFTTADGVCILNNVFKTNGVAIGFSDAHQGEIYENWNTFHNNTTDRSYIDVGEDSVTVDPGFVDAPNGNFTTTAAGLQATGVPGAIPGATGTTSYQDIGLQQLIVGGSGGTRAYGSVF